MPNQGARLVCIMSKIRGLPAATPDWSPAISTRSCANTEQHLSKAIQANQPESDAIGNCRVAYPHDQICFYRCFRPSLNITYPPANRIPLPAALYVQVGEGFTLANSTHGLLCFTRACLHTEPCRIFNHVTLLHLNSQLWCHASICLLHPKSYSIQADPPVPRHSSICIGSDRPP